MDNYIEELRSVRSAIARLTADPSATTSVSSANGGSYSVSNVDLKTLYARERELVRLLAEYARGGSFGISYPIYCGG